MRGERGEILTQANTVDVHSVVCLIRASVESIEEAVLQGQMTQISTKL